MGNCRSVDVHQLYNTATLKTVDKYIPPISEGVILSVHDGDTITIGALLPGEIVLKSFSIRLLGINAPEISRASADEIAAGIKSRDALLSLIPVKSIVRVANIKHDKYGGRLDADVYIRDIHINKWMVDGGYAKPYTGSGVKSYK